MTLFYQVLVWILSAAIPLLYYLQKGDCVGETAASTTPSYSNIIHILRSVLLLTWTTEWTRWYVFSCATQRNQIWLKLTLQSICQLTTPLVYNTKENTNHTENNNIRCTVTKSHKPIQLVSSKMCPELEGTNQRVHRSERSVQIYKIIKSSYYEKLLIPALIQTYSDWL